MFRHRSRYIVCFLSITVNTLVMFELECKLRANFDCQLGHLKNVFRRLAQAYWCYSNSVSATLTRICCFALYDVHSYSSELRKFCVLSCLEGSLVHERQVKRVIVGFSSQELRTAFGTLHYLLCCRGWALMTKGRGDWRSIFLFPVTSFRPFLLW